MSVHIHTDTHRHTHTHILGTYPVRESSDQVNALRKRICCTQFLTQNALAQNAIRIPSRACICYTKCLAGNGFDVLNSWHRMPWHKMPYEFLAEYAFATLIAW